MINRLMPLSALAAAALLSACQTAPVKTATPPTSPEVVGEFRKGTGYLNGYIDRKELPDSLALVPPPPAPGSARQAADLQQHQQTRAQQSKAKQKNDGSLENIEIGALNFGRQIVLHCSSPLFRPNE